MLFISSSPVLTISGIINSVSCAVDPIFFLSDVSKVLSNACFNSFNICQHFHRMLPQNHIARYKPLEPIRKEKVGALKYTN
jgi:hypothetical protein